MSCFLRLSAVAGGGSLVQSVDSCGDRVMSVCLAQGDAGFAVAAVVAAGPVRVGAVADGIVLAGAPGADPVGDLYRAAHEQSGIVILCLVVVGLCAGGAFAWGGG